MLKITKGLKKKKKGKKSKHKEEELFKPEELEAYRREHQQHTAETAEGESSAGDEWKKFQALTAGVDDILRKTQGDLDRIKSTSFFQRVPVASEVKAESSESWTNFQEEKEGLQGDAAEKDKSDEDIGIVAVSESECEDDQEDDIFDTAFVDAIASGEVKLAYIPESPTFEDNAGDDPFDTSIAERAILGPAVNSKGRKLVPLGAAVEVLTGRVELTTCATVKRPSNRRILKQQQDLLLGSFDFDDNGNTAPAGNQSPVHHKSLLDDDAIPLNDVPIDLGVSLHPIEQVSEEGHQEITVKDILEDFDELNKKPTPIVEEKPAEEEDEDDEFAQLAAESLAKVKDTWNAATVQIEDNLEEEEEEDPFDTTFADNILPGKAELKLIENEILNVQINLPEQSLVEEKYVEFIKSNVSIHLTNPTGDRSSISSLDRVDESSLTSLQPIHRDLLGGSNTDLSKIVDDLILPSQVADDSFSDYSDPFDTSIVDQIAPGQVELKYIEKELLGESDLKRSLSDPDFDPRAQEDSSPASRPDLLEINVVKNVKFAVPSPNSQPDLLVTGEEEVKNTKPLTPYYVRENSIPELELEAVEDPFDTSFLSDIAPGKAELKLLEDEFISPNVTVNIPDDEDFDPRASSPEKPKELNVTCTKLEQLEIKPEPAIDLLSASEDVAAKVLTPAVETQPEFELSYADPFDTSIANNILPGKTELKLLENELMQSGLKRNLTDPDFDPRDEPEEHKTTKVTDPFAQPEIPDLFDHITDPVVAKPLTPVTGVSFEIGDTEEEDIDPFDTSLANNLVLGRTELKLLESELIQ